MPKTNLRLVIVIFISAIFYGCLSATSTPANTVITQTPIGTNTPVTQKPISTSPNAFFNQENLTIFDLSDKSIFGNFGASVYHISVASNGDVWINLKNAIGKFDDSKWMVYPMDKSMATKDGQTAGYDDVLMALPDNKVWMTLRNYDDTTSNWIHYLYFFDGENWTVYTKEGGLLENNVYSAIVDKTGSVWFSTSESSIRNRGWFNEFGDTYAGASKFDGTKWTSYQNIKGYLAVDYSEVLWTSSGQTISSFGGDDLPLSTFSKLRENLFSKNCEPGESFSTDIIDMDFSPNGTAWLLFLNCGIAKYYQGTWSVYENPEVFAIHFDQMTSEICTSPDGKLWVARGGNLYNYDSDRNDLIKHINFPRMSSMACAPDGSVWLGSLQGYIGKYNP